MERFSTCDLRQKDVINLCDGVCLGEPSDFEFSVEDGRITALVVTRPGFFSSFFRSKCLVIPWCKIECIGEDAILVRLSPEECFPAGKEKKKKKHF